MGADGVAGAGAAGSKALDGPADFGAVHGGEVAGFVCGDGAGGGGLVEGGGVGESGEVGFRVQGLGSGRLFSGGGRRRNAGVPPLRAARSGRDDELRGRRRGCLEGGHLEEVFVGGAVGEELVGEEGAGFGGWGFAAEVEHVAGEDGRELDEVGGHGVADAFEDVDALPDFDPVAGEAAEGLVHGGEEGNGAGAGELSGFDHEAGEELGVVVFGHEGAGAGFYVEHEGVEACGELLAHDAGGDEVGGSTVPVWSRRA